LGSDADVDDRNTRLAESPPARDAQGILRMGVRELADDVRKQARTGAQATQIPDANAEGTVEDVEDIEDQIETVARDLEALLAEASSVVPDATGARP
jgi:hypothetical protein